MYYWEFKKGELHTLLKHMNQSWKTLQNFRQNNVLYFDFSNFKWWNEIFISLIVQFAVFLIIVLQRFI